MLSASMPISFKIVSDCSRMMFERSARHSLVHAFATPLQTVYTSPPTPCSR